MLSLSSRRKIISLVVEFMIERKKTSANDKIAVAKAIVDIFPVLVSRGKNIEPYVSKDTTVFFVVIWIVYLTFHFWLNSTPSIIPKMAAS